MPIYGFKEMIITMTDISIHPSFLYFAAAFVIPWVSKTIVRLLLLILPIAGFLVLVHLPEQHYQTSLSGLSMQWVRTDSLSLIFAYIFLIMSFIANLYALHTKRKIIPVAGNIYVGGALGAVLAGDLFVLYVFLEVMAVSSTFLIFNHQQPRSKNAAMRYILMHIAGGLCLLAGILIIHFSTGSHTFDAISLSLGGWLILIGFALNAAIPPLHAWLVDAYPESTPWASVFLCTFTTKTAVYCLARAFTGTEILVWVGALMAIYGVAYALLENNIRRLLSYHIVSQVGFMVCGIGLGSYLSLNGASSHAFCHILYKGLLFMSAGAVLYATGKSKITELGGLFRVMPLTFVFFLVGAFSISGAPLFNGFISKSMIITAASESHRPWIELMLIFASIGTFLSVTLKLGWFAFFNKDAYLGKCRPLPFNMNFAMFIVSFLCILTGIYPDFLYRFLPHPVEYHPYTISHIIQSVQLFIGTALGFYILIRKFKVVDTITLDIDWFYKIAASIFIKKISIPLSHTEQKLQVSSASNLSRLNMLMVNINSRLNRPHAIGQIIMVILLAFLLIAILSVLHWR